MITSLHIISVFLHGHFFNRSQKWNPSCNQPFGTVILGSLSTFQMITSPLHLTLSEDAEAVEDISLKQRSAEQWQ